MRIGVLKDKIQAAVSGAGVTEFSVSAGNGLKSLHLGMKIGVPNNYIYPSITFHNMETICSALITDSHSLIGFLQPGVEKVRDALMAVFKRYRVSFIQVSHYDVKPGKIPDFAKRWMAFGFEPIGTFVSGDTDNETFTVYMLDMNKVQ